MNRKFLTTAIASLLGLGSASATTIISGSVADFTGPDDLLLDPATNVIAVDVAGDNGSQVVNGVTFQSDGTGISGTTSNGGVSVATAATHVISGVGGWSTAPNYTGADAASTDNLERIMHDIRWSLRPSNVSVDITGLVSGQLYNVQLLFSENGSASNRHWDIGVDGTLLVDDFNTNGTGVTLGRVYSGTFDPGADGALNFLLGEDPYPTDPNNTGPGPIPPEDHNPILHGVIVHTVIPEPGSAALIGLAGVTMLLARRRRR